MYFDLIPSTLSPLDLFLLLLNTFFPATPSPHFLCDPCISLGFPA